MIDIPGNYTASLFGNTGDIIPSADNIRKFLDIFGDKGLLPSTMQELTPLGPQICLRLASTDEEWNILFRRTY